MRTAAQIWLDYGRTLDVGATEKALAELDAEVVRLRAGLDAAIRAANLALFVIRKQGVMPNSSWEAGFAGDMAAAKAARNVEQRSVVQAWHDEMFKPAGDEQTSRPMTEDELLAALREDKR